MNELVNDLYQQARLDAGHEKGFEATVQDVYQRFAQLIVRECLSKIENEADQYAEPVWAFELVNDIKDHFGVDK
jgi:hypothetical protein